MKSLPEISVDQLRSVKDIEILCSNSAEQTHALYQSIPLMSHAVLTASRIANKICPKNYNSKIPDSRQQGVLSTIFDLQQRITLFSGYPAVSLAALNCRMAMFSCLSMVVKYHKKNRQQRSHIVLMKGLDDVADVAKELNLHVRFSDQEHIVDFLNDDCAALVLTLPGVGGNVNYLESIRAKLNQFDIQLIVDGSGQYLSPQSTAYECLWADILHLDVGYICGLDKGGSAVLSNTRFSDYLPLPIVGKNAEGYQWKKLTEKPLSIGVLSDIPLNLQVALHCLIYLRMQDVAAVQQQAIQSMVMASYLRQLFNQAAIKTEDVAEAAGCCVVVIEKTMESSGSIDRLLHRLTELPIRVQIQCEDNDVKITLANLHQLDFDQLQRLIEMFILQHRNSLQQKDKNGR
jgi:glycine dehydrogenase subunit 2